MLGNVRLAARVVIFAAIGAILASTNMNLFWAFVLGLVLIGIEAILSHLAMRQRSKEIVEALSKLNTTELSPGIHLFNPDLDKEVDLVPEKDKDDKIQ